MNSTINELADELEQERATLDRELTEIELLLGQVKTEAERHEARRVEAEGRLAALETDGRAPAERLGEARTQLMSQTRRATMMQAQLEVLQGKQRALQRYHARVAKSLPVLRSALDVAPRAADDAAPPAREVPAEEQLRPARSPARNGRPSAHEVLAAQEELRREIARQMHDGPAQSIANIALQAQIVQRLFDRNLEGARAELDELVGMVEDALKSTKEFIFDMRPMVLDDLGLVPTLRRATAERMRRSAANIRFESIGSDGRLPSDVESALYRIVNDTMIAYGVAKSPEVVVRLDWSETELRTTVQGRPQVADSDHKRVNDAVAAAKRDKNVPAALATMIREQEEDDAARDMGLSADAWSDISERAESGGFTVQLSEDGWVLQAVVRRA